MQTESGVGKAVGVDLPIFDDGRLAVTVHHHGAHTADAHLLEKIVETLQRQVDPAVRRLAVGAVDAAQIAARSELEKNGVGGRGYEQLFERTRRLAPFAHAEADVMLVAVGVDAVANSIRYVAVGVEIELFVKRGGRHAEVTLPCQPPFPSQRPRGS